MQSLVFRKYVLRLQWRVEVQADGGVIVEERQSDTETDQDDALLQAAMQHLQSLTDCLEVRPI